MLSITSRVLLPCGLLVGLASGCAQGSAASGDAAGTPAPQRPDGRSIVTSEDLQRTPDVPIETVLMSRIAGIVVTRGADGAIAIRIRGANSFSGSSDPLYIIDGIPFQPGPGGSLTGINPHDIASIEVLKDAASTAIYGMRGANGVILVKTKHADQ